MGRPPTNRQASGAFMLGYKERLEQALQMRIDGFSLRQISEVVDIDHSNLGRYFKEYKSKEIEALREELFSDQTARLMELWRAAVGNVRKFVPVVDGKGDPLVVPVLTEDGQPIYNSDGEQLTEIQRDFAAHNAAINVATKVTDRIAAHFGLDAPTKTLMMNAATDPLVFRIVDGRDGRLVEYPAPQDESAALAANAIGADSATSHVVGGVECVTFSIPEPSDLKYHG